MPCENLYPAFTFSDLFCRILAKFLCIFVLVFGLSVLNKSVPDHYYKQRFVLIKIYKPIYIWFERERERGKSLYVLQIVCVISYLDSANTETALKWRCEVCELKRKKREGKYLWGASSLFLSNSGFHLFHLLALTPSTSFTGPQSRTQTMSVEKGAGDGGYQRSRKSQRDFWGKKWRKREETNGRQSSQDFSNFISLIFFFPPKKLEAKS